MALVDERKVATRRLAAAPRRRLPISTLVLYVALLLLGLTFLAPLIWVITTSLQPGGGLSPISIPDPPRWQNFADVLTLLPLPTFFLNSVIITVSSTVGTVITSSLVGFSLARLRWPGRDLMFALVLITMMLPGVVTLVPGFLIFRYLGWLDTFWPLIVPAWAGGAFYVFLTRQFFMTIPMEMDQAARIDGAGNFQIYWRVILPLSQPVLATMAIFSFLYAWNDFLVPSIYLNSVEHYTLSLGLNMYQGRYGNNWNDVMAAAMYTLVPVLILFFAAQRYFIKGIQLTGLAGR
jgi:ABC-type glycerol-3-phosphate transport system permease component